MKLSRRGSALGSAALLAAAVMAGGPLHTSAAPGASGAQPSASWHAVCPAPPTGYAACNALQVDSNGPSPAASSPSGYGPTDLQSAYSLATAAASSGAGSTVAIVDAYDDPNAVSDVSVYRNTELGAGSGCTTVASTGCTFGNGATIRKVNQSGGTSYPRGSSGWAEEISLDVDMVSAICPKCSILLVEASSNSFSNLGTAVDYAASAGAVAISNSYGGGEFSQETGSSYDGHFNHPGTAITVSSGDSGYGVEYPAASQYVTAVGGTTLNRSGSTWTESVWSGAGSGCSAYEPKPSWQKDTGCSRRTVADVAADADPNTGVAVYDTFREPGWLVFGGTSVASPIVASVYALAGNATTVTYGSYPYSHTSSLNDVTTGSNGSCGGSYLCTGTAGYDGPTGNGTPSGTGAF